VTKENDQMKSITEIYENLSARDAEYLEKQAEAIKVAEEDDAAGRIMARGFADEACRMLKLARMPGQAVPETPNDLGAIRQYKLGPKGATGVNSAGQQVQSNAGGFMTPAKPPRPAGAGATTPPK
jgi:hypothetical protein